MLVQSRSLPGNGLLRPQPSLFESEDGKTVAVVTNWGSATATQKVFDQIQSALAPEFFDPDVTQFKVMPTVVQKPIEAKLVDALRASNEEIFKSENDRRWRTVVEVTVLHMEGETLFWAQAGLPHILVTGDETNHEAVEILSMSSDASMIYRQSVPLPMAGLGLDEFPNISSGSVALSPGCILALLSVPGKSIPIMTQANFSIEQFSEVFYQSFPDQPGWVATIRV